MIHLILTGFPLLTAYILLVLVSPVGRCLRCRGRKVTRHGNRVRPCKTCRATGRAYRPGAVLVHQAAREHAWPWLRDRLRDRISQDPR